MSEQTRQNSTKFDILTPTQRIYVTARALGKTVKDAAAAAGISRTTHTTWDRELINGAILERQATHAKDAAAAVAHLLPGALAQLEKAVASGDLRAVVEVLDRTWGKAKQQQEIKGTGEPFIVKVLYGADMDDL